MSEIQDVVNYVLNSPENTNPAILTQLVQSVSGNGMPAPPEENGVALISYKNQWVQQEGYGYNVSLEMATCDMAVIDNSIKYVCVSDLPIFPKGFGVGSSVTLWVTTPMGEMSTSAEISTNDDNFIYGETSGAIAIPTFFFVKRPNVTFETEAGAMGKATFTFPKKGLYFLKNIGISQGNVIGFAFGADAEEKLIAWDEQITDIKQISSNLIPSSTANELFVTFTVAEDGDHLVADVPYDEIDKACDEYKLIRGKYYDGNNVFALTYRYTNEQFEFIDIFPGGALINVGEITLDLDSTEEELWIEHDYSYHIELEEEE